MSTMTFARKGAHAARTGTRPEINAAMLRLEQWILSHGYAGYEPFDGLSSYMRFLTLGNLFLERCLQQAVRQSPINVRPFLGVRRRESTKGRGYFASGFLRRYLYGRDESFATLARENLAWLSENRADGHVGHAWGNHFDFSSRIGKLPTHEPIIVWTSLIGQSFLDAYEILDDERYLQIARSVCTWILTVPRELTPTGNCLSYVAFEQRSVHNANLLGAAMLARTGRLAGESYLIDMARDAVRYSCARQRDDGSWYYAEDDGYHWIDCFHTGYNLDSIARYLHYSGDDEFRSNLRAGLQFFSDRFVEPSGRVKYYHDRLYPIDIQCIAQAIDTLVLNAGGDPSYLESAAAVARWAIANMQNRDGSFAYRMLPAWKVRTPMLHWGQGTMYKALASLVLAIEGLEEQGRGGEETRRHEDPLRQPGEAPRGR